MTPIEAGSRAAIEECTVGTAIPGSAWISPKGGAKLKKGSRTLRSLKTATPERESGWLNEGVVTNHPWSAGSPIGNDYIINKINLSDP
jgi:hypothetical protein